jgi:hypothetical protein
MNMVIVQRRKGGAVRMRVMLGLKPSVWTTEGWEGGSSGQSDRALSCQKAVASIEAYEEGVDCAGDVSQR